jgi:hypothetical protein
MSASPLASAAADARQRALAVGDRDQHPGFEGPQRLVRPFHADEALGILVLQPLGHAAIGVCTTRPSPRPR